MPAAKIPPPSSAKSEELNEMIQLSACKIHELRENLDSNMNFIREFFINQQEQQQQNVDHNNNNTGSRVSLIFPFPTSVAGVVERRHKILTGSLGANQDAVSAASSSGFSGDLLGLGDFDAFSVPAAAAVDLAAVAAGPGAVAAGPGAAAGDRNGCGARIKTASTVHTRVLCSSAY
ncbi:hypothetical protein BD770DRAFT_477695 [Pilaira anomala]|nr:hypothetical protein BD770DRAFT_477695 [Pilaira anomala]